MSNEPVAVGVDVGGTKVVAGLLHADGTLTQRQRTSSPRDDGRALVDALIATVRAVGAPDLPIGIGIAGIVGRDGTLRYSPNHGVHDVPVGTWVREALGISPVVVNDANAAVWAESQVGAGRGQHDVVMLTLGTGIGGGLVLGGRLVEGAHGFAAEFGHMVVDDGGRPCFANPGGFEAYASGTAIGRTAVRRLADGEGADSHLATLPVGGLTGKVVTEAAVAGDVFAQAVLGEVGRWLGVGLVSLVAALDPSVVLVGGGAATDAAPWLFPPAREELARRIVGAGHRQLPDILLAQLGDDAGMIGAGLLAALTA